MLHASPKTAVRLAFALGAFALLALSAVPAAPRSSADGGGIVWDDALPDDKNAVLDAPLPLQPFADVVDGGKPPVGGADDISPAMLGGAKGEPVYPNLEASLDGVAAASGEGASVFGSADAASDFPPSDDASSTAVSVYAASDISDAKDFLERHGVPINYSGATWLEASVPARLLGALSERADVIRVETIIPPVADQAPPPSPTPEPCRAESGTLNAGALAGEEIISGTWDSTCLSFTRAPPAGSAPRDRYARFYTFTLSANADVTMNLVTPDGLSKVDPYLFLRSGQSTSGTPIASNDDRSRNPPERDSRIVETLDAGTYTVEATSYHARQTGSFTLTIAYAAARANCGAASLGSMSFTSTSLSANGVNWPSNCLSAAATDSQAAYYTFSMLVSETVEISLTSSAAGADPILYLRRGTQTIGTPIASDDGGTGSAALMRVALSPGIYTIEAASQTAAATGTFSLSAIFSCSSDLGALSGASASAKNVNSSWLTRCLSTARSGRYARFYTFTLNETRRVDISLSSFYADTYMYLRSGTGSTIARNDDASDGVKNSFIQWTLDAGSYTVEATTFHARAGGGRPFSLSVSIKPDCAISAAFGALTAARAAAGTWASDCESATRHGRFARFYTFSVSAAAFVEIDLQSANADAYLYLREGDGTQAGGSVARDDDGGAGRNSKIIRRLTAGTTYTIEATTVAAADYGSFTLTLAPSFITLCAAVPLTLADGIANSPANQSWTSACHSARIHRGYAKHYTFTLAAPKLMTIALNSAVADTTLYLTRGNSALGGEFIGQDPPAHGGTPTRASRIERILSAGAYILEAAAAKPEIEGAFTLSVEPAAITPLTALAGNSCRKDLGAVAASTDASDSWTWTDCGTDGGADNDYTFTLAGKTAVTMDLFPNALNAEALIEIHKQRAGWSAGDSESTRWESVSGVSNARGKGAVRLAAELDAGTYRARALPDPASVAGGFGFRMRASAPPSECASTPLNALLTPLTSSPSPQSGMWSASCDSARRPGAYSREYSFSLAQESNVTIDLTSDAADAYLYLEGAGTRNRLNLEDDDGGEGTNARITATLQPSTISGVGGYIVEATTDERGQTGAFTLAITVSPTQDQPPTRTSCFPAEDMGEIRGRASRDGTWTDDCDGYFRTTGGFRPKSRLYTFNIAERSFVTLDASGPGAGAAILLRPPERPPRWPPIVYDNRYSGDGLYSRIRRFLDAGTYLVEVAEYRLTPTPTREFTFTVSATPLAASASGCETELGTITRAHGSVVRVGAWAAGCDSENRAGAYARRYAFTLENPARVNISTQAGVASHLYIRRVGASENAAHLTLGANSPDWLNRLYLPMGNYVAEAAPDEAATGGVFAIAVSVDDPLWDAPSVHNTAEWNAMGYTGAGVKVGVIDGGFRNYAGIVGVEVPAPAGERLRRRAAERLPERRRVGRPARRRRRRGDSRRRAGRGAVSVQLRVVQRRAERGGGLADGARRGHHKHVDKLHVGRAAGRLFAIRERHWQAD